MRLIALSERLRDHTASERKRDAQRKIRLGGLVIKAGLGDIDPAFILGALMTAREAYEDPNMRQRMQAKGGVALARKGQ